MLYKYGRRTGLSARFSSVFYILRALRPKKNEIPVSLVSGDYFSNSYSILAVGN